MTNRTRRMLLMLLLIVVGALILVGCSSAPANDNMNDNNGNTSEKMTLEELAEFDGKDGNKAYIAVDGIIYDVTDNPAWPDGEHNGVMAGQDVSDILKNDSPHDLDITDDLPVIGELE